jgi:hypothetical protein
MALKERNSYQNYNFDQDKALGLHIDTDLVIDSSFGVVHDILANVFGIANPTLHLHAALGEQTFGKPLAVRAFALEGIFAGVEVIVCSFATHPIRTLMSRAQLKPFDGLEITKIGLRLHGIPSSSYPDWKEKMMYDFDIFGEMTISAPSGPLVLSYVIGEGGGVAHLSAHVVGDVWSDAFGVKGLGVSPINMHQIPRALKFDFVAACRCQLWNHILHQRAFEIF